MLESFTEDDVAMLWNAFLELLLEIAASVLILAQCWNLALKVLQSCTREAVNCAKNAAR